MGTCSLDCFHEGNEQTCHLSLKYGFLKPHTPLGKVGTKVNESVPGVVGGVFSIQMKLVRSLAGSSQCFGSSFWINANYAPDARVGWEQTVPYVHFWARYCAKKWRYRNKNVVMAAPCPLKCPFSMSFPLGLLVLSRWKPFKPFRSRVRVSICANLQDLFQSIFPLFLTLSQPSSPLRLSSCCHEIYPPFLFILHTFLMHRGVRHRPYIYPFCLARTVYLE